MADFAEQLFSWQDELFGNNDAKLEFKENHPGMLWPGIGKPGLYLSKLSQIARLLSTCSDVCPIPPIFKNCSLLLEEENEIIARDSYWEAITSYSHPKDEEEAKRLLIRCIEHNPFVGEPHLVLAQAYLRDGQWEEAARHATCGNQLLKECACPWDKRISFGGWFAWSRVLLRLANERNYPSNSWQVINLGLTV